MASTPAPSEASHKSLAEWREETRVAMSRGELLQAYDLADRALLDYPDDPLLKYRAVLALARAGATQQARARYDKFQLGNVRSEDQAFEVDLQSLDARIAKNEALEATGAERVRLMREAAAHYDAIFRRTGDSYPGVNAATLSLLNGEIETARALAGDVLEKCSATAAAGGDSYYVRATLAEAALILGYVDEARAALEAAARTHGGDFGAVATTRRQLRMVCEAGGIPAETLASLGAPSVIHFTGHRIGPRLPEAAEESVRSRIAEALELHNVGFGYGSLAAGADILFAEELIRRKAEVNVSMPFDIEEFKRVSVASAGEQWLKRFDDCLRAAQSITYATTDEYLGDDSLFGYASRMAMGLASLRARFLDTPVRQIAVWDGGGVGGTDRTAGAAADVRLWRSLGLESEVINPFKAANLTAPHRIRPKRPQHVAGEKNPRSIKAMLFGDFKGFSILREAQLPVFVREAMGRFARVLDRHRKGILFCNTWGDGLYIVTRDVVTAATCAIELQEEMASFEPANHGLPEDMGLRLGAHLGPVFRVRDPIIKRPNFIGAHVSRAARIEPVTPEGAVYVTEAFAAVLTSSVGNDFICEYVGQLPAAKHYGVMRMYSLRRRSGARSTTAASR
jgi:tetratricopeptide (TPR) repeat protein